jgi:hypothetical protein
MRLTCTGFKAADPWMAAHGDNPGTLQLSPEDFHSLLYSAF